MSTAEKMPLPALPFCLARPRIAAIHILAGGGVVQRREAWAVRDFQGPSKIVKQVEFLLLPLHNPPWLVMASSASSSSSTSLPKSAVEKIRKAVEYKKLGNASFVEGDLQTAMRHWHDVRCVSNPLQAKDRDG